MGTPESRAASSPPPLLPPRATSNGTQRRLLEEALARFGARGYHGVSVREIATGAGIKASSVYAHVESKEQLLFDLMLLGHVEHHERLRQALLESGSDPREQIAALMMAHVRMHATYPLLARISNREAAALTEGSRARVTAVRADSERMFMDVIERGVRLGEFVVDDVYLATAAVAAMGIRVAEWWDHAQDYAVDDVALSYAQYAVRLLTGADAR